MIRIENLHMRYRSEAGEVHAVRGINLDVAKGQFYTLLGPSGCGKTTTLRCVAGLEQPDSGEIWIGDEMVYSSAQRLRVPSHRRDVGMVFQSYAIWPHLDVFENVALPLREGRKKYSADRIGERVRWALRLVKLEELQNRPAPFLSGGQQQRLALARALALEPAVLLLDEPLSNLDAKLREETRLEISDLVRQLGITTLYVTHDQTEALVMSDRVAVLSEGRVVQEGTPKEIYQSPRDRFVANFIGTANFLEGEVAAVAGQKSEFGQVKTETGIIYCQLPNGAAPGDAVIVLVRPEDVVLCAESVAPEENVLPGRVEIVAFVGDCLDCQVKVESHSIRLKLHPQAEIAKGQMVWIQLPPHRCQAIQG